MPEQPSTSSDFPPSPQRLEQADILQLHQKVTDARETINAFNALPGLIMVLTHTRQIVYANESMVQAIGNPPSAFYLGARPGELFNCQHAYKTELGCGSSQACRVCGALNAILGAINNKRMEEECRITRQDGEAMDLRVWTHPYVFGDTPLILLTVADISGEKRRRALERIFFHDVINTAGGIRSVAHILASGQSTDNESRFKEIICSLSDRLMDEIQCQRIIGNAEHNELVPNVQQFTLSEVLKTLVTLYRNHEIARGKHVSLTMGQTDIEMETDPIILNRILGNMLKNALEASTLDDTVELRIDNDEKQVRFQVFNPQSMPRDVQLQVFNRSFSTKGAGRGLGTYSIKLLGEKYLHGEVSFSSSEENGTIFTIILPRHFPATAKQQK